MKVLISACLLGERCKYDGGDNFTFDFKRAFPEIDFVPICPEVDGGLPTPRTPCEIRGGKVLSKDGKDLTENFKKGADLALLKAKESSIGIAILKAKSPSCGSGLIYDGTFSHTLVPGDGITGGLLKKAGLKVFTEGEIPAFEEFIKNL